MSRSGKKASRRLRNKNKRDTQRIRTKIGIEKNKKKKD